MYARRLPRNCASNAILEPIWTGFGVCQRTDWIFAYHVVALSGSAAKAATSARGRSISISVVTSTVTCPPGTPADGPAADSSHPRASLLAVSGQLVGDLDLRFVRAARAEPYGDKRVLHLRKSFTRRLAAEARQGLDRRRSAMAPVLLRSGPGARGTAAWPDGFARGPDGRSATLGQLNAWNAREFASKPADETPQRSIARWRQVRAELRAILTRLDATALDEPVFVR